MTTRTSGQGRARAIARAASLAAAAAALAGTVSGCASGAPTVPSRPAHASPITLIVLRNDTPSTVKVIQCVTSCQTLHERRTIPAGSRTIVFGSNEGIRFGYLVEDMAGRRLGCIYMKFDHVQQEPTVLVSSMGRCE